MARQVMDQLISGGEIKRGRIGVAIQDLTPDIAQALGTTHTEGAVIARVEQGSPAERAGLRTNDLVVAVNGAPIHNGAELRNRVGLSKIGDAVDLTIVRGASERTIAVRIDQESLSASGHGSAEPGWRKRPMKCSVSSLTRAQTRSARSIGSSPRSFTPI